MDKLSYCVLSGTAILFLFGCLMHLSENDIFSLRIITRFWRLICFLIVEVIIDCVFFLLEGSDVNSLILYSIKVIELIMNPILAFLVFAIFYDERKNRRDEAMAKLEKVLASAIIASTVLTVSVMAGLDIFHIDETNYYHRGSLMFLYVIILLAIVVMLIYGLHLYSSNTQSTMKKTLIAFTSVLMFGVILRYYYPNSNYDFLCLSAAMPFLLVYYSHIVLRVDPLTKLLNRRVYMRMLERINYTTVIIMIDANNFKLINDTHGHECGDQTLKALAKIICKTYGKYAYCFRLGGDEFCAILRPGVFDELVADTKYSDAYVMSEAFMEKLNEAIAAKIASNGSSSGSYLEYGVSQGYGIFYSAESYPSMKERMPLDKVIELADRRMYQNKEVYRKQREESSSAESGLMERDSTDNGSTETT